MDNQTSAKHESDKMKRIIVVLVVLLVISGICLAARHIYMKKTADKQSSVTISDNIIEENTDKDKTYESGASANKQEQPSGDAALQQPAKDTAVIKLYKRNPEDNTTFEVMNMLPGDIETKEFELQVYHKKDIELFFNAEVTEQTKQLEDVLKIKVTSIDTGKVLIDAPFSLADGMEVSELLVTNEKQVTNKRYKIDVYLDTSVGNEYCEAMMKADFKWYIKDDGSLVNPPKTSDPAGMVLWGVFAISAVSVLLLLMLMKRRKEQE